MAAAFAVTAALAAALHVFIFYLESFAWTTKARGVFGTSEQEAENTKEMAFNQGFYNLFLALIAFAGIALLGAPARGGHRAHRRWHRLHAGSRGRPLRHLT